MSTALPQVNVNEVFGPTIQGEGMDMGKPCFFLRLHHCPVKCPGCDTAYTWNGTEPGAKETIESLKLRFAHWARTHPGAGVVVSGGEPIIHYKNPAVHELMWWLSRQFPWVSLETSGFVRAQGMLASANDPDYLMLESFVRAFSSVHISPKVTPCLHGDGWTDEELLSSIPSLLFALRGKRHAFKFVVRDQVDLDATAAALQSLGGCVLGLPVYIMPYGVESEEVLSVSRWLSESGELSRRGWILSPRLHSLMYGKRRGV